MERIAEIVDRLDNLVHALELQMPAELHIKAIRESLPDVRDELKKAYLNLGGEDVWD